MKNASGAEGRGWRGRRTTKPLFPSEGNFTPVVPLSHAGGPEEQDETTLVPARVRPGRRTAQTPYAQQGVWHSWAFIAVAVALSALAGAAAGFYILRSQQPEETYSAATPAEAGVAAAEVRGAEPTAEPPAQPTPSPTPQTNPDELAAAPESAVPPPAPAAPPATDTKVEKLSASAPPQKGSPQAAEPPARRAAQPEPRAVSPARAEASPAPRVRRAEAAPRRPREDAPAAAAPRARPPLVSSPPPSAKTRKVIQWP